MFIILYKRVCCSTHLARSFTWRPTVNIKAIALKATFVKPEIVNISQMYKQCFTFHRTDVDKLNFTRKTQRFQYELTVTDGILLQQIRHIYMNNTSLFDHQVVAMRDLATSRSTCANNDFGHNHFIRYEFVLTEYKNNGYFRDVKFDVAIVVCIHSSIISKRPVGIICFPDSSVLWTVLKILIIGNFVWKIILAAQAYSNNARNNKC